MTIGTERGTCALRAAPCADGTASPATATIPAAIAALARTVVLIPRSCFGLPGDCAAGRYRLGHQGGGAADGRDPLGLDRHREVVALHEVAAQGAQGVELLRALDPLGHDVEVEGAREADRGAGDRALTRAAGDLV